jgi:hypothetical protein
MTKENIQEVYKIAEEQLKRDKAVDIKDFVQIGIQVALNGEVLYSDDGSIQRIE